MRIVRRCHLQPRRGGAEGADASLWTSRIDLAARGRGSRKAG